MPTNPHDCGRPFDELHVKVVDLEVLSRILVHHRGRTCVLDRGCTWRGGSGLNPTTTAEVRHLDDTLASEASNLVNDQWS